MKELIKKILSTDLSPNQYIILYCLKNNIYELNFDTSEDTKCLKKMGYVDRDGVPTSKELHKIDEEFQESKSSEDKMLTLQSVKFMQLFPPSILPSGAHARGHLRTIRTRLKAFMSSYPYDWSTIFQATENYIARYERQGYKFMRNCPNFIFDRNGDSVLALECDIVQNNTMPESGITI